MSICAKNEERQITPAVSHSKMPIVKNDDDDDNDDVIMIMIMTMITIIISQNTVSRLFKRGLT